MASRMMIHLAEDKILAVTKEVIEIQEAYTIECRMNDGFVHPSNRDDWGTLRLNVITLRQRVEQLLKDMNKEFK